MECASGLIFDFADRPKAASGDPETNANFREELRGDPTKTDATASKTIPAPATLIDCNLPAETVPFDHPRPFPITLFLRCTPIINGE
jgi:hypothetical protein